jgi:hypothetical protein
MGDNEHEAPFKRLCWIKCGIGLERWVWGERPRWQRRAVGGYSDLLDSTGQRVVQLTKGGERGARIVDGDLAR